MTRIEVVRLGPGPGRWRERNLALEATEADVIAFTDHDVHVPPDWEERLRAAWSATEPGVAAIGGPVSLRGRPGWAGPALDTALGALDHGPEPRRLDPREATLVGANISFRVWQLAAIGGFKRPPDESGDSDWFAEEHEAQRELGRWGWAVEYEPALRVERDASGARRRALLRARFRYGARQGRAGSRARGPALRQAAGSLTGVPLALARRSVPLAMERAARAGENLGTALARVASAPPAAPAPREGAVILLYHRIAAPEADPLGLCVSPEHFAEQLEVIRERAITVAELAAAVQSGEVPSRRVAVTFDDGYADNLLAAAPLLRTSGVPATVFAATGHIASGEGFFWDALTRLLLGGGSLPGRLAADIGGERREWATGSAEERRAAWYDLHHQLQPRAPEVIAGVLEALGARHDPGDRPLTEGELAELSRTVDIGAHTRRHVSLRFQPSEVQRAEIEGSRDDVAAWAGAVPEGFSYPFGVPRRDFVERTKSLVRDAGFGWAVGNHPGVVDADADLWSLPRFAVPDVGGAEFRAWLEGLTA